MHLIRDKIGNYACLPSIGWQGSPIPIDNVDLDHIAPPRTMNFSIGVILG